MTDLSTTTANRPLVERFIAAAALLMLGAMTIDFVIGVLASLTASFVGTL